MNMKTPNKKKLSEVLLKNSRISGVTLNGKSKKLSNNGHGLYIKSDKNDQYIDLRMLDHKPFWGHTHPLMIQNELGFTPSEIQVDSYSSINLEDISQLELKNSLIKIDESFIELSSQEQQSIINEIKKRNDKGRIVVWEKDLILAGENIFITHSVDCPKILEISQLKSLILHGLTLPEKFLSGFDSQLCRFNENILFNDFGKIGINLTIIDEFIKNNQLNDCIQRKGHYLIVTENKIGLDDFLNSGIYINESQIRDEYIILCFPTACTKAELLDSLIRLKTVLT